MTRLTFRAAAIEKVALVEYPATRDPDGKLSIRVESASSHLPDGKREFRAQAIGPGIPVYDEMMNLSWALSALAAHKRFLSREHAQEGIGAERQPARSRARS